MTEPANEIAGFASSAFRQYATQLHRFLVRRLGRPQDVDDLAHEVYIRLARLSKPELVRQPRTYLFSVASNLVREFRLRNAQERERVTYDSDTVDQAAEHPTHVVEDELADRLNLQRQIERALLQLPPTQRAVLLLVKRDGLSHAEAAKKAGLSVHTVEKYVTEAVAKMMTMEWDR